MTPKRFSYRRRRPEFTFIGPEISLVSVEGVEVDFHKWHFDGGWGNNEYLMRHIPTQTRFLVDTGAETLREVMTARLVEVRDDYPMPDSEQIISLGRAAIGYVYEELPDSRATPRRRNLYSDAISNFAENEDCSPVDAVAVNPRCIEIARWFKKTAEQVAADINRHYIDTYRPPARRE